LQSRLRDLCSSLQVPDHNSRTLLEAFRVRFGRLCTLLFSVGSRPLRPDRLSHLVPKGCHLIQLVPELGGTDLACLDGECCLS
jgi:hypothetical protein